MTGCLQLGSVGLVQVPVLSLDLLLQMLVLLLFFYCLLFNLTRFYFPHFNFSHQLKHIVACLLHSLSGALHFLIPLLPCHSVRLYLLLMALDPLSLLAMDCSKLVDFSLKTGLGGGQIAKSGLEVCLLLEFVLCELDLLALEVCEEVVNALVVAVLLSQVEGGGLKSGDFGVLVVTHCGLL
jgi:hypothetical protein